MKVYRIVSRSILVCLFIWGIIFGLLMTENMGNWDYTWYDTYNGDAYTGIQNATADAANNIIEVHNDPKRALCDGAQSLDPTQFDALMKKVNSILPIVGKSYDGK